MDFSDVTRNLSVLGLGRHATRVREFTARYAGFELHLSDLRDMPTVAIALKLSEIAKVRLSLPPLELAQTIEGLAFNHWKVFGSTGIWNPLMQPLGVFDPDQESVSIPINNPLLSAQELLEYLTQA